MLKLANVNKTFGEKQVLKNINLQIANGEVFGLVGENGAGKTTLFNIISQVLAPTSGQVEIEGELITSLNQLKGKIGYILDIPALHDFLTAREYLEFLAAPQNLTKDELTQKINILLRKVNLQDAADQRIKGFSRGMRQRLGIAAGLVSNPKIVLMDEPSSALDPIGRNEVLKIIEELASEGKTIVLSTHILTDIEKVCTRVGLLVNGEIVITGTVRELLKTYQKNKYVVDCDPENAAAIINELKDYNFIINATTCKEGVLIEFEEGAAKDVQTAIKKLKTSYDGFNLARSTIEEIFFEASKNKNTEQLASLVNTLIKEDE